MIELKIAEIEENKRLKEERFGKWRFILAKQDSTILLYAGIVPDDTKAAINYRHVDIARQNNLSVDNVIGGGDIHYTLGDLSIGGSSFEFGPVPNQIMEEFAKILLKEYGEKYSINIIDINMDSDYIGKEGIEFWKELGYSFDNRRRVLERVK